MILLKRSGIALLLTVAGFLPGMNVTAQYFLADEDVVVVEGVIVECTHLFQISDIVIPDTLDGQTVTGIARQDPNFFLERRGVFEKSCITSVKLPSSIEFIGDGAFRWNQISELDLTACYALRSIGEEAFADNRLESVDLDACVSLVNIGIRAFYDNHMSAFSLPVNLENRALGWIGPDGSTFSGGDQVHDPESFYYVPVTYVLTDEDVEVSDGVIQSCSYCFDSRRLVIPDTMDGQAILGFAEMEPFLEWIYPHPQGIFSRKGLVHVKFPATIEVINNHTFRENQLTGIDLSECTSLTIIGEGAFAENAMTYLDLSACTSLTHVGIDAFGQNEITNLDLSACKDLRTIDDHSFRDNKVSSVNLNECRALMKVGDGAFSGYELSEVALDHCTSLVSIGSYAFHGDELSNLVLPVHNEYDAFGWKDLEGNHYSGGDTINNLNTTYFVPVAYTIRDEDVVVTDGIIESCSYDFAFRSIIFPDTLDGQRVTGIAGQGQENGMFRGKGIVDLVLPPAIEVIGEDAFEGNHLKNLDLGPLKALSSIGSHAFASNAIAQLELGGCTSLTSIGDGAFWDHRLTNLDLSMCNALVSIGDHAFRCTSNNGLGGLVLPEHAEYSMYGWKDSNGEEYSGGSLVSDLGIGYYIPVPVPYTLTDKDVVVEDGIIQSCSMNHGLNYIIIPETLDGQTVKGISHAKSSPPELWGPRGVFAHRGITGVILPSTMETIGDQAFEWNDITSLDISACHVLKIIGKDAFSHNNLDIIDFSTCVALEVIEDQAFYVNNLNVIRFDSCFALKRIGRNAFCCSNAQNLDFSSLKALKTIGEKAFLGNNTTQIDLSGCHSLISLGKGVFKGGASESIILPVSSDYDAYGWKDLNGVSHTGSAVVQDLETSYYIPVPYTLKDEDVEATEGVIRKCSPDLPFCNIIIPDTLDGQAVEGITGDIFSNRGLVTLELPSTLSFIEGGTFYNNYLSHVDFSKCAAMTTIGPGAFHYNNLTRIDLTACTALTTLHGNALSRQDDHCNLLLPSPDIPGYQFHHWSDTWNGINYEGGATVTELNASYMAILSPLAKGYSVVFILSDGSSPLPGAGITLSGYGLRITNIDGKAVFTDVLPKDEIGYTATADGYESDSSEVSVSDTDVTIQISLDQATSVSLKPEQGCLIYPNPARSEIHVEIPGEGSVRIISLSGKPMLIQKIKNGLTTIDTSSLEPGIYILRAESGSKIFTRKLIIR